MNAMALALGREENDPPSAEQIKLEASIPEEQEIHT